MTETQRKEGISDAFIEANKPKIVRHIRAHGKSVIGCKSTERDIMISFNFLYGEPGDIQDIFLTTEEAKFLLKELTQRLQQNTETI